MARQPEIDISGRIPVEQIGWVVIGADKVPIIDVGAYQSGLSYTPGNHVATSETATYLCIQKTDGTQDTANTSYWKFWDPTRSIIDAERVFQDVPTGVVALVLDPSGGYSFQNVSVGVGVATGVGSIQSPAPSTGEEFLEADGSGGTDWIVPTFNWFNNGV